MFASIPAIIGVATTIINGIQTLTKLGETVPAAAVNIAKKMALLGRLFAGGKITEDELDNIRAENDALNAEIEGQTEAGH